ncbi:MAG: M50 family metallopeptidase [Deltaproteobacteria bacterium]|nr:M50 family metallopeptidase [Deltaproteobacteria bacterium]
MAEVLRCYNVTEAMVNKREQTQTTSSRGALLLAVVVTVVVGSVVPFGRLILYPFTLMATWVHEMGHGLAALCVGGGFDRLEVFANASGLAHTRGTAGWGAGAVSIAGLLAPPLVGCAVLVLSRGERRARAVLLTLALAMVLSCAVWVRNVSGVVSVLGVAFVLLVISLTSGAQTRLTAAQFVGLRLVADTVSRMDYVFAESAVVEGVSRPSDIARVATEWGGPRIAWSLLVAAVSLSLLALGLWAAWWERAERAPVGR